MNCWSHQVTSGVLCCPSSRLQSQARKGSSLVFATKYSTALNMEDSASKKDLNQWTQEVTSQSSGGGSYAWQWGGRRTFLGEVIQPSKEARVPRRDGGGNRGAVTEEWVPDGNRSGNVACPSKEAISGGTQLVCRYWQVLKDFHLVFWVKGRTCVKGSRTGKEITIC